MSLAWTALTPSRTADAIFGLNTATDWASFRDAVSSFAVPAQNIVYADRDGDIGYQAPGQVPIRKSGNDGLQPQAGWRSENDWTGDYVPFEGLPTCSTPTRASWSPPTKQRISAGATRTTSPTTGTRGTARSGSATSSRSGSRTARCRWPT